MKRRFPILLVFLTLLTIPAVSFAYSSNICTTGLRCTAGQVGVFMADISSACGNTGDCTLTDILMVFTNLGNYIIGIIGAIALMMYVVGGFFYLISGGSPEKIKRGKSLWTNATIGLSIVMFSYLGIYALRGVLEKGTVSVEGNYTVCNGMADTIGDACGLNSTCTADGTCKTQCEQQHPNVVSGPSPYGYGLQKIQYFTCIDKDTTPTSDNGTSNIWYTPNSCQPNQCPGDDSVQCCLVDRFF